MLKLLEITNAIKNYKLIIKHLKSHIAEGNYDDLDIEQLQLLENEVRRLSKLKTGSGVGKRLAVKAPKFNTIWNVSNPNKAQEKAYDYLGPDAKLYLADDNIHKYQIYNPKSNRWIRFGSISYQDFTFHKDLKRRDNYIKRASNIEGNWKSNPYSPNNLSIKILW